MAGKVALGTVQFGLDYGISNTRGKIPPEECRVILKMAFAQGIDLLDTAFGYGESESIIGEILSEEKIDFKLVTKFPDISEDLVEAYLKKSLIRLRCERLYGYLLHDTTVLRENADVWQTLQSLKAKGLVEKIGISVYYPSEVTDLLERGVIPDIVQLPYNVLDRRFETIFERMKECGIEVHVRSVFLQGLLLQAPGNLGKEFLSIKDKLLKLENLASKSGLPVAALLLQFALSQPSIEKVVIGIDGLSNFVDNMKHAEYQSDFSTIKSNLLELEERDERIILPMNWARP